MVPTKTGLTKRSKWLCSRCRSDGKACQPQPRPWDSLTQQRCKRCIRLHHACGPPETAGRRTTSRLTRAACEGSLPPMVPADSQVNLEEGTHVLSYAETPENPRTKPSRRKQHEKVVRYHLKTASDLASALHFLCDDFAVLNDMPRGPDPSFVLKADFETEIRFIESCLRSALGRCADSLQHDTGPCKTELLLRLETLDTQWGCANFAGAANKQEAPGQKNIPRQGDQILFHKVKNDLWALDQRKEYPSTALHVAKYIRFDWGDVDGPATNLSNDLNTFEQASLDIDDALGTTPGTSRHFNTFPNSRSKSESSRAFPTSHIVLQTKQAVLLAQCFENQSIEQILGPQHIDRYGRTIFHAAAYYHLFPMVEFLLRQHPEILDRVELDQFGLSPLCILILRQDFQQFDCIKRYLSPRCFWDSHGNSILNFACYVGAEPIVRDIVENELVRLIDHQRQPILDAIQGGHQQIAQYMARFSGSINTHFCNDDPETLRQAQRLAEQNDMHDLAEAIQPEIPWDIDPNDMVAAMNNTNIDEDGSNIPMLDELFSSLGDFHSISQNAMQLLHITQSQPHQYRESDGIARRDWLLLDGRPITPSHPDYDLWSLPELSNLDMASLSANAPPAAPLFGLVAKVRDQVIPCSTRASDS